MTVFVAAVGSDQLEQMWGSSLGGQESHSPRGRILEEIGELM